MTNYTSADYSRYFYSDNPAFEVINTGSDNEQYLQLQVMHDHEWSQDYRSDDTYHWHTCTQTGCTAEDTRQEHVYEEREVVIPPGYFQDGMRLDICVCGKTREMTLPRLTDTEPPTGDIIVRENSVKRLLNNLTFGWFFKNTIDVTITADDNNGVDVNIEYAVASSETDPESCNYSDYEGSFSISPSQKSVVYAKLTDVFGNVSYVSSDGLVIYKDSQAITTSTDFIKISTEDVTAVVSLNGNAVKAVTVGGTQLVIDKDYTVSGGNITFKAAYLNTLAAGSYIVVISYYPLGVTETPTRESDTPATTSFSLNVVKATPDVSVAATPAVGQTRPNTVTLSAALPAGATGTLQFKADGENIGDPVEVGQSVSFAARGSKNNYIFTVEYSGDDNYSDAISGSLSYSFEKGQQAAITFAEGTPTQKTYGDDPFDVTAIGGSGTGAVTYSVESGPAVISGNTVTLTGTGTVKIKAIKAEDDDYKAMSVEHIINVVPKPVTIVGLTAEDKVYDGTSAAAVAGTAVISGKVAGDEVYVCYGVAFFADKTVGNSKTVTFNGFSLTGDDAGKYILLTQPVCVTANITAKPITLNVKIKDKAYDGINTAAIESALLNDVVSGDNVSLIETYPTATYSSVEVGSNITVNFNGSFELTGADAGNYSLTQPRATGNITNTYTALMGIDYTVNSNGWLNTDFIVTAKEGYELSLNNTADGPWSNSLTRSDENSNGSLIFFVRNKETGAISLQVTENYKIDKSHPAGDILMGESSVKKALNTITFGLFFNDIRTITITADDADSGIASVLYKLSSAVLSEDEVQATSDWSEYTDAITLEPEAKLVVYSKITDVAGNIIYLGSDGLVLEYTAPVISGIEDEKVYCGEVTVTVTDDNLDTVAVNGTGVTLTDNQLTLLPAGELQTIAATDKAGNSTTVTITVYASHEWDDGIITTAPTAAVEGVRTHTCNHCGDIKTEAVAKLPPSIIEGAQSSWQPGTAGADAGLTFRSEASFADFICVLVDGEVVDPRHYDLKEGSIIVTLKPGFLATLSPGTHTIGIKSVSGIASAEFVIEKNPMANIRPPAIPAVHFHGLSCCLYRVLYWVFLE